MQQAIKVMITDIHKEDAYFNRKDLLLEVTGTFRPVILPHTPKGYHSGPFVVDKDKLDELNEAGVIISQYSYFLAIKYKEV